MRTQVRITYLYKKIVFTSSGLKMYLRVGVWDISLQGINLYCIDEQSRTVRLCVHVPETVVLGYQIPITEKKVLQLDDILHPIRIQASKINPNAVLLLGPSREEHKDWEHSESDPGGKRASFEYWTGIRGDIIEVQDTKLFKPPTKETYCELEFEVPDMFAISQPSEEVLQEINLEYWLDDYVVYSLETETHSESSITCITMVTKVGLYFYTTWDEVATLSKETLRGLSRRPIPDRVETTKFKNEKKLLLGFLDFLSKKHPRTLVSYKAKTQAWPHVLERLSKNKIPLPNFSQVKGFSPQVKLSEVDTFYGKRDFKSSPSPGVLHVDLYKYFQLKYPLLGSYDLRTVAMRLLQQRENFVFGRSIKEVFHTALVLYDFFDEKERRCLADFSTDLGTDPDEITSNPVKAILKNLVHRICPAVSTFGCINPENSGDCLLPATKELLPGVYDSVYIYSYAPVLRGILASSQNKVAVELAKYLKHAPLEFVVTAFTLDDVATNQDKERLHNVLSTIDDFSEAIGYKDGVLYSPVSVESIDEEYPVVKLIAFSKILAVLEEGNYIDYNGVTGRIEFYGLDFLTTPQFAYQKKFIREYLLALAGEGDYPLLPAFEEIPITQLVSRRWIRGDISHKDALSISLVKQAFRNYGEFQQLEVEFVMTTSGPELYFLEKDYQLNADWYIQMLKETAERLQSFLPQVPVYLKEARTSPRTGATTFGAHRVTAAP